MKKFRNCIGVLLCLGLFMSNAYVSQASSSEYEDYGLNILDSINTHKIKAELNIESSQAKLSAFVVGKNGTSKVVITMSLEKKSKNNEWKYVKSWSETSNGKDASMKKNFKLTSKGTYRCMVKAEITKDGLTEISTSISGSRDYK